MLSPALLDLMNSTGEAKRLLRGNDRAHLLHPVSLVSDLKAEGALIIASADGIRLRTVDDREYIDGFSGLMNVNVGYGRRELAETVASQLRELSYTPLFFGRASLPAIELGTGLARLFDGAGLATWHFTSGGSEANETAIKLARLYFTILGRPEKRHIISRARSYHGVTYGALGATALPAYHEGFGPVPDGFSHVAADSAEAFEQEILAHGAETVAAVLVDPVSLPGGLRPPPAAYWRELEAICARHDVLMIVDEVVSGFARTGRMFAIEHWDVRPHFVTLAKGITSGYAPLGAVGMRREIADAIEQRPMLMHGVTAGGHPASCAVALRNIALIEEERLTLAAAQVGARLLTHLSELRTLDDVADVRGFGMLVAIEFTDGDKASVGPTYADRLQQELARAGLLVRSYGSYVVLGPPLITTENEADRIGAVVSDCVRTTLAR